MKLKFLFSIALTLTSFFIHGQSEALLKASNSIKIDELKEKMYKFLGNFNMDFDINLNELKFNSHKIYFRNRL